MALLSCAQPGCLSGLFRAVGRAGQVRVQDRFSSVLGRGPARKEEGPSGFADQYDKAVLVTDVEAGGSGGPVVLGGRTQHRVPLMALADPGGRMQSELSKRHMG